MKILLGPLLAAAAACSCAGSPQRPALSFEPQPRDLSAQLTGATRDPKLAVSSSGMLSALVVHDAPGGAQLAFTMSHDGGDRFTAPVPVSSPDAAVRSHGENSPSLAITPTAIHAVWEQQRADGVTELVSARSLSYGHSFEKPVVVTDGEAKGFHGFASLAVAPNGNVYVAWLDGREADAPAGTFAVFIARSQDRGATFERNRRIAVGACPCCRPRVAVGSRGEIFVAWRRVFNGNVRDMVVSRSRDGGASFAEEVRVADDGWKLDGCPDSGAAMVESGGRLYVAWLTEGRDRRPRLELAWSDDGAAHFGKPIEVARGTQDANHPSLSASEDGRVILAFEARDGAAGGGWEALSPYVVELAGDRASAPQPVSKDAATASYPSVAGGTGGRVYVVWTGRTDTSATARISRGRFSAGI